MGEASAEGAASKQFGKAATPRSICLCLLLLPLNALWVVQMEMVRYSAHPTTISLFFNAVFILVCLTGLNRLVALRFPHLALHRGELLLIYTVVCIGSCVCGHDMLQVLVPFLTYSFRHQDTNDWATLFNSRLRPGLFVSDPKIYMGFYLGSDSIWKLRYIAAWLPVSLAWTLFLTLLLAVMLCINAILRRQWTSNEKLTYPIAQIPLQITQADAFAGAGIFRSRPFLVGFLVAAGIDVVNGLNYYYPSVPTIFTPGFGQSYLDIGPYIANKPWNAIGWTPVSFYPFLIGLGMFMPLDFLFSCFFFYWFWKLEHVGVVAFGYDTDPRSPYAESQSFGAYISFAIYSFWISRAYLAGVARTVLGLKGGLPDGGEAMGYRTAVLGILVGMAGLTGFSVYMGLPWWIAIGFFLLYFALAISITRMRAELGTPVHDLHYTGPEQLLTRVGGSAAFSPQTLSVFAVFYGFNRAYRGHPMPHQLEGYKFAEQTGSNYRRWTASMLLLGALAIFVGFWTILHLMYAYGLEGKSYAQVDTESFTYLTSQIKSPTHAKFQEAMAVCVGVGIAFLLQWLRLRLPWWPLHPLAFAVTSSWEINLVWCPLFIAWVLKTILLRYGGRAGFQKMAPCFIGLILGQFMVGSVLNLYGIARNLPTYQFWQ